MTWGESASVEIAARGVTATASAAVVVDSAFLREHDDDRARRDGEPSTAQTVAKHLLGPSEPPLDGADRPAKLTRGLFVGPAFEETEDDCGPVRIGQAIDLVVEHRADVEQIDVGSRGGNRFGAGRLAEVTASGVGPGSPGDAVGDAIEPVAEQVALTERIGLLDQHEKRGLEGVIDVVRVVEQGAADSEHGCAVACDDCLEGGVVTMRDEPIEELPLGQSRDASRPEEPLDLSINDRELPARHDARPLD
jgi:hypothetical protein